MPVVHMVYLQSTEITFLSKYELDVQKPREKSFFAARKPLSVALPRKWKSSFNPSQSFRIMK
jgi:hypothetical protein